LRFPLPGGRGYYENRLYLSGGLGFDRDLKTRYSFLIHAPVGFV
jgi:hypothetical protein